MVVYFFILKGYLRVEAGYERFLDKLGRFGLLYRGKYWEYGKEMEI